MLWLASVAAGDSVVVAVIGSRFGWLRFGSMGERFSVSGLWHLCSLAVGAWAFSSWLGAVAVVLGRGWGISPSLFAGGCAAIGRACWSCLPGWQMGL